MVPKKILLCTDFSENSRPAREVAIDYAQAFGAGLVILHVVNSSRLGFPAFEMAVPVNVQEVLKAIEESVEKGSYSEGRWFKSNPRYCYLRTYKPQKLIRLILPLLCLISLFLILFVASPARPGEDFF